MDALRVDPRGADELLHLAVCHVDAVESARVAREGVVGPVELGEAWRAGTPVEVRRPEPVRGPRPERIERGEVARQEHDLAAGRPRPGRRAERVARVAGD